MSIRSVNARIAFQWIKCPLAAIGGSENDAVPVAWSWVAVVGIVARIIRFNFSGHGVLVLVVVSVARGDMDKVGNAERIGKIILHLFLRNPRNPLFH